MKIIGRKKEINELEDLYNSNKSEFVAISGRRRVGKTFLISELFRERITFHHVGISPDKCKNIKKRKMDAQLEAFHSSLVLYGMVDKKPKNWYEAFSLLIKFIESKGEEERVLIFIDELPWLDTPKSGFVSALEWFWNIFGGQRQNLMFVVCGSSSSWMLNELIQSHGGLFHRVTHSIHLFPFSLKESEQYFLEKGYRISKYDISLIYMVFGGIPFYLNYYQYGEQIETMIDRLFFDNNAKLKEEYDALFASSFDKERITKRIVEQLSLRKGGFSRKEFLEQLKISDGDEIGKALKALINSNFVLEYTPFKENKKNKYYKVVDPFCLFYLKNVKDNNSLNPSLFQDKNNNFWQGSAFENLCYYNIESIKKALGINGVKTMQFSFLIAPSDDKRGAQIDLLIERKDNVIHLIEMKFANKEYEQNKDMHLNLLNKIERVRELTRQDITIYPVLITTYGLIRNEYFLDYSKTITLEELFND